MQNLVIISKTSRSLNISSGNLKVSSFSTFLPRTGQAEGENSFLDGPLKSLHRPQVLNS